MLKRSGGILAWRMLLPVDFPAKIKFVAMMLERLRFSALQEKPRYPPSPLHLWNHQVSKKFAAKSG